VSEGRIRAAAAALAAVAAAAALLTGCGGGGGAGGGRHPSAAPATTATATAEPPASPSPGIGPDGTAETGAADSGGAARQPTVPRARLTPATGTFTNRQKDYLVGKVPKGMDPSAVLQTGQESCERIANTADASPALARQAIRDGEIPDARDAITYLCPKYENLLD
jgi:hypothetical protein